MAATPDYAVPIIDTGLCSACGECIVTCHAAALTLRSGKAEITDPARCDYCGDCEAVCPTGAVSLSYEVVDLTPRDG